MAEIACLSPFHFHRVFRALTGPSAGELLAALRLEAAKRLVLTTALSVTEVCFALGYASPGTFTTRFTQLVGLSPLRLRHLVEDIGVTSPQLLHERYREAPTVAAVHDRGVCGTIAAPGPFTGLIFVGLFRKTIPQGRPAACVTLAAPGRYQLALVPDGRYSLFVAALSHSPDALTYLLPESGLLVGAAARPVLVRGGRARRCIWRCARSARPIPPSL